MASEIGNKAHSYCVSCGVCVTCVYASVLQLLYFIWQTETLHRRPSAAELFVATHSKVDESGHRVWCDTYAQGVYVSK